MRKDLLDRLARLETQREALRPPEARPIDRFEAERVYKELMQRASTAAPVLPDDPHEAARAYMDFVSGR